MVYVLLVCYISREKLHLFVHMDVYFTERIKSGTISAVNKTATRPRIGVTCGACVDDLSVATDTWG